MTQPSNKRLVTESALGFALPPTGAPATDYANLQALANAMPVTGGSIILRPGDYDISGYVLNFPYPTKITGAGKGDMTLNAPSRIMTSSATADAITTNGHGSTLTDFAVINTSSTTPTAGAGIHILAGDAIALTRVKVAGFWNNFQTDQARHYTFTDCHGIDAVNYSAYLRNTAPSQGDFGDCTFQGCFFNAYSTTRVAAAAIRWESGGGLKVIGCKTNGNMPTLGQSFTIGLDVAVADGISTSVLIVTGNSFEGIASGGCPLKVEQYGTGTGFFSKVVVTGNESLAGGGFRFVGTVAGKLSQFLVSGNVITGPTAGIYFKNCSNFTVGRNRIQALPSGNAAVWIDTGCTDYTVEPQDVDTTNVAYLQDDSAQSNTHSRVGSTARYTREIPSTTSNVTYTTLFSVQFNAYCAATLQLNLSGQVSGLGSFVYNATRAALQSAAATVPALTTIGTDVATANAPTVLFDVTSNQTVLVKVRLGASGADVFGNASLLVDGLPSRVWKS